MKITALFSLIFLAIFPSFAFATTSFACPTNFNFIHFGMTPEEVTIACGKPDQEKEYVKPNENIPQEWSYYIPQTVSMGGGLQPAQGTMKTTVTFDDKGRSVNISVNGIGVGTTTICGGRTVNLGADKETIKAACGDPAFITKQSPSANSAIPQDSKIMEFTYTQVIPQTTLVFEDGRLSDKR